MELRTDFAIKYSLAISEYLTLKQIMKLCDCGQPTATIIRNKALKYCIDNNIDLLFSSRVPTFAVLKVINRDIDYYYDKMILESKMVNYA